MVVGINILFYRFDEISRKALFLVRFFQQFFLRFLKIGDRGPSLLWRFTLVVKRVVNFVQCFVAKVKAGEALQVLVLRSMWPSKADRADEVFCVCR